MENDEGSNRGDVEEGVSAPGGAAEEENGAARSVQDEVSGSDLDYRSTDDADGSQQRSRTAAVGPDAVIPSSEFRVEVGASGAHHNEGKGDGDSVDRMVLPDDEDEEAYAKRRNSLLEAYIKQEETNSLLEYIPSESASSLTFRRDGPAPAFTMATGGHRDPSLQAKRLPSRHDERSLLDPPLGGFKPLPIKSVLRANKGGSRRKQKESERKYPEPKVKDLLQMRQVMIHVAEVYIHTYIHPRSCLLTCLPACLPACQYSFIHPSIHPYNHQLICPFTHTFIHPHIHASESKPEDTQLSTLE